MIQHEFKVELITINEDFLNRLEQHLNTWGQKGWQLASIHTTQGSSFSSSRIDQHNIVWTRKVTFFTEKDKP